MNNSIQKHAGSRYSTISMVQVAIFGAIICIMAGIYTGDHHPHPGHYRFTADGAEEGRRARISFRSDKFYQ